MIIDVHTHYGKWKFPSDVTVQDILAYMKREGIATSIISSALGVTYEFREGNRELREAIEGHPGLLGYVTVNLNYLDESLAELAHYLGSGRTTHQFVGVKVHQMKSRHRYNTPEALALTRAVAAYGVPILVHTFSSSIESPWNVVPVAKAVPEVPIILAHMGGDTWLEGVRAAKESPNLYVELCGSWTDPHKVRVAIEAVGAERVLFGTDATLFDPAHMLGALQDAGLSVEEKTLIMGENAHRLFKLER